MLGSLTLHVLYLRQTNKKSSERGNSFDAHLLFVYNLAHSLRF